MIEDAANWRLKTAGGIPYKLYEGSPQCTFQSEKAEIKETWIVQASDFESLVAELLEDYGLGGADYRAAYAHPGMPELMAMSVTGKPFPDGLPGDPWPIDSAAPDGTYAKFMSVDITFSTPDPSNGGNDPDDPEILDVSATTSGEFLIIPSCYGLKWEGGSDTNSNVREPDIPITKLSPMVEWSYRFKRRSRAVIVPLLATARPLMGCVNSGGVSSVMSTEPETVLFMAWTYTTRWTWKDTEPFAEVEYKFLEKRINDGGTTAGHNHFFNPKEGKWLKLKRPDGTYAYTAKNLAVLI